MDKLLLPRRQNAFFFTFPNASFLTLISKLSSKSVYLVFLLVGATFMLNAQVWNKLTPSPAITDGLIGIHFIDAEKGYVVGNGGSIRKTTDGGVTWTSQTSTASTSLYSTFFLNAFGSPNIGFAVGDGGVIRRTANGGTTWTTPTLPANSNVHDFRAVWFFDQNTGFAVGGNGTGGNGVIFKTIDAGLTWTDNSPVPNNGTGIYGVFFTTLNKGFVSDFNGKIITTTDGGTTWITPTTAQSPGNQLGGLYFTSLNEGYAVGGKASNNTGVILKTTNGGTTWNTNFTATTFLSDIKFVGTTGFVNGGTVSSSIGSILKTTNAGSTWTTETINPAVVPRLVRLALPCPSVFYACGLNGTVLKINGLDADFTVTKLGNCGNYQFTTNTTTTGVQYTWNFNDPSTGSNNTSTQSNPTHQFSKCGTYNVCLTTVDGVCTSSVCHTVTVIDTNIPTVSCPPNTTVNTNAGVCYYTGTLPQPTGMDSCSNTLTFSCSLLVNGVLVPITPNTQFPKGTNTIQCTATDFCGNISLPCTYTLTVKDNEVPKVTCPNSLSVTGTLTPPPAQQCKAIVTGLAPIASDNCPMQTINYSISGATIVATGNADASGTMFMQGLSTVTYTTTDMSGNTSACAFTVTVKCDTCKCGTFSSVFARPIHGGQSIALPCGSAQSIQISCPKAGQSIPITGKFDCLGGFCPSTSTVTWTLTGPTSTTTGTVTASPYFFLAIAPAQYAQPGNYTLTLQGTCGGQLCQPCIIKLTIDCANPCPCDPIVFKRDLALGFANAFWNNSCKVCFSPLALTDCDMVDWSINGLPVGMTNGKNSFCHTFPNAGTYTVAMTVTRKNSNGTICAKATYSKQVKVTCKPWLDCTNVLIANPKFAQGASPGVLGAGGTSTGWYAPLGNPIISNEQQGTTDGWSMLLSGNADIADVLSQTQAICMQKDTGLISLRFGIREKGIKNAITIHLFSGKVEMTKLNGCGPICNDFTLADIDVSDFEAGWIELQVPYDLRAWTSADTCTSSTKPKQPHLLVRPALYVSSATGSNQGGAINPNIVVDNICLGETIVSTNELSAQLPLLIFPNPNTGSFIVELPQVAISTMLLRIHDVTGRLLFEKQAESGNVTQTIETATLANGLYFLQVVSEKKILGVARFVKQ
jgi:photosystem II stability/assembly factor-like uncharacterized protein